MAVERTLSILKPDGVRKNVIGEVYRRFEQAGLRIIAARMKRLSQAEAEGFYAEHKGKPFFEPLVQFMTSGPVVLMILEGEDAIQRNRTVMGATNPANAAEGTLRKELAASVQCNAVHGSDSPASAARETSYFFAQTESCPYEWKRGQ